VPQAKKTDLQVLRALLSMPAGKLSASEKRVFQEMFDKVATGHILRLSPKQRMWADSVYDKHDLDKERPPPKNITVKDKSLSVVHPLDNLARPTRPPGRA
jgi:hypothetical protein